ncbi:DUF7507 domain-containing protein [Microbacterium aquimaris]|uniref:DUF7507 domain-containing protein n=1 Tax=Microbacterium aquimaris TaxID=459816 RepID=A0ABU5N558_9MICO|nr:hypothetical protein [Microbacterium aquimaris]MDZ8161224.1 hypothetical protein [Microbacterium aquimaris]
MQQRRLPARPRKALVGITIVAGLLAGLLGASPAWADTPASVAAPPGGGSAPSTADGEGDSPADPGSGSDAGDDDGSATIGLPGGDTSGDDSDAGGVAVGGFPALEAMVDAPESVAWDQTATVIITIRSTGATTPQMVSIAQAVADEGVWDVTACADRMIEPVRSLSCTTTYTPDATSSVASVRLTATVVGIDPDGNTVTSSDAADIEIERVVRTVGVTEHPAAQVASWTYPLTFRVDGVNVVFDGATTAWVVVEAAGHQRNTPATCSPSNGGTSLDCTFDLEIEQTELDARDFTLAYIVHEPSFSATPVTAGTSSHRVETVPGIILRADGMDPVRVSAGDTVTQGWTIDVNGGVSITAARLAAGGECPAGEYGPGSLVFCSTSHIVTQADLDAGFVPVSTSAHADTSAYGPVASASVAAQRPLAQDPSLTVTPVVAEPVEKALGETVAFDWTLTNTGNVTLVDVRGGDATCSADALAPGEAITCTTHETLTQAQLDAGVVATTASGSATGPGSTEVLADPARGERALLVAPGLTLSGGSFAAAVPSAGETVTLSWTATNTGDQTLRSVRLGDIACSDGSIAPGGSVTCTVDASLTQEDIDAGSLTSARTVTARAPGDVEITSNEATATVLLDHAPEVALIAPELDPLLAAAGDVVVVPWTLTNVGNVTVTAAAVDGVTCSPSSLAPGRSATCDIEHVLSQEQVDAGVVRADAVGSAVAPRGSELSAPASTTVTIVAVPALALAVEVVSDAPREPGDPVRASVEIGNTGTVTLVDLTVVVGDGVPFQVEGCDRDTSTLAPGATTVCSVSYVTGAADLTGSPLVASLAVSGTTAIAFETVITETTFDVDTVEYVAPVPEAPATASGTPDPGASAALAATGQSPALGVVVAALGLMAVGVAMATRRRVRG